MTDCASQLDRITGGLNAINLNWLFNNNHNANIFAVGGSIIHTYNQMMEYRVNCDLKILVEEKLNPLRTQLDKQLFDVSGCDNDLAHRVKTCVMSRNQQPSSSSEYGMDQISEIYWLGNCIMLNYPGYS